MVEKVQLAYLICNVDQLIELTLCREKVGEDERPFNIDICSSSYCYEEIKRSRVIKLAIFFLRTTFKFNYEYIVGIVTDRF